MSDKSLTSRNRRTEYPAASFTNVMASLEVAKSKPGI